MKVTISRRGFLRGLAGAGTMGILYLSSRGATAQEGMEMGELKSLKIRCISETGWFNTAMLLRDIRASGGVNTSQYKVKWTRRNEGAYTALIEAEELDGGVHTFLLDTGWNKAYTEWCFQREGVDELLRTGRIEFIYITHEHIDHFWGLPVSMRYNPETKLVVPSTFTSEGRELIQKSGHRGELEELEPGRIHKLFPGCVSVTFDIPILLNIRGEQVLYFNIKERGLVVVTGCCHPTINRILEFSDRHLKPSKGYYGLYGGLHIALLEKWNPKFDRMIDSIHAHGFEKIGSNHCTGYIAVRKMLERNLPVVKGTASYGSKSDLYIGNGDQIVFG